MLSESGRLVRRMWVIVTVVGSSPAIISTASAEVGDKPSPVATLSEQALRVAFRLPDARIKSLSFGERHSDYAQDRDRYSYRTLCLMRGGYLFQGFAHGGPGRGWEDDPFRKQSYLCQQAVHTYFPFSRRFHGGDKSGFPSSTELPMTTFGSYLIATGLWPQGYWRPPTWMGQPVTLDGIATDVKTPLRIAPQLEVVNQTWCHVVHFGDHQTLWVDADRGCCIVARLYTSGEKELSKRFDLYEHVEVLPGIWLPTQMLITIDKANDSGAAARQGMSVIDQLTVNTVAAEFFRPTIPPGAYCEAGEHVGQVVAGGEDLLDEIGHWLARAKEPAIARVGWLPDASGLWWGLGVCIAGELGMMALRRLHARLSRE
ncbi:MAG TPA: hypothetical protein VG055_29800 [Planctomycetaceae bacterium]|jgi:hypothetical protein|nr:hypothetical protein [Planctomycetaceae bacterium]